MKSKFYAWKDGKQRKEKQEWVELTPEEFFELCKTNRSKSLSERRYFYQLPGLEKGDFYLYLECDYEHYKKSRIERHERIKKKNEICELKKNGKMFTIVSLDALMEDESGDSYTLHDLIADPDAEFEEQLVFNMDVHLMLKILESDEREIIDALFFDNPKCYGERKIASKLGMGKTTLHKKKVKIFEKIRKNGDH